MITLPLRKSPASSRSTQRRMALLTGGKGGGRGCNIVAVDGIGNCMGGVAHGSGPEAGSCSSCIGRIRPDSITEGRVEGRSAGRVGRGEQLGWTEREKPSRCAALAWLLCRCLGDKYDEGLGCSAS